MGLGTNTPLVGCIRAYAGAVTDAGVGLEVPTSGSGWLLCNGAAVSRTTYDDLFALLSTTYGVGDGSTTFNIPNLRDRFPVGLNLVAVGSSASGVTGGEVNHTLLTANIPAHSHSITLGVAGAHTHTGTTNTSATGGTEHYYQLGGYVSKRDGTGASKNIGVSEYGPNSTVAGSYPVGPVSSGYSAAHTHSITLPADSTHAAAHTLSFPNEGAGGAHNNLHPYIAFNFVIKY